MEQAKAEKKTDWFHSILDYLHKQPLNDTPVELNTFLNTELKIENDNLDQSVKLKIVLDDLKARDFIKWGSVPEIPGTEFGLYYTTTTNNQGTLKWHKVNSTLTFQGNKYIENRRREIRNDSILERQATSAINANKAVESNIKSNKWLFWLTLSVAVAGATFQGLSYLNESEKRELKTLLKDTTTLKQQIRILQDSLKYFAHPRSLDTSQPKKNPL